MSIKKAVEILDFLIDYHKDVGKTLADPAKSWNIGQDNITRLAKTISEFHGDDVRILKAIKKEIVPNCKHPKKMRDRTKDGQWYCMNCNMDL